MKYGYPQLINVLLALLEDLPKICLDQSAEGSVRHGMRATSYDSTSNIVFVSEKQDPNPLLQRSSERPPGVFAGYSSKYFHFPSG